MHANYVNHGPGDLKAISVYNFDEKAQRFTYVSFDQAVQVDGVESITVDAYLLANGNGVPGFTLHMAPAKDVAAVVNVGDADGSGVSEKPAKK